MKRKQKKKNNPLSYQQRTYRGLVDEKGLISFQVVHKETDLHILAPANCREKAKEHVVFFRNQLENYIAGNQAFLKSFAPIAPDPLAPRIAQQMISAARQAGVGPMAAVAGAMAECLGKKLLEEYGFDEIAVENGGDIFLQRRHDCRVAIYAGQSPLSNKVGIVIQTAAMPCGVCTSSASIGHSLSLGQADAVTVVADSTLLADAAATRLGNETKGRQGIEHALEVAKGIAGINGVVIIRGEQLGAWGEVELVQLS